MRLASYVPESRCAGRLEEEQVSGSMFFAHFHQEHEPDMRAWLEKVKSAQC